MRKFCSLTRSFCTKALFIKSFLSTIIIVISLEWEVNMLWHSEELENESKKRSSDARESSVLSKAKWNEKLCREMEKADERRQKNLHDFHLFFFSSFSLFRRYQELNSRWKGKRWKSFGVCDLVVWEKSFLPRNVGCFQHQTHPTFPPASSELKFQFCSLDLNDNKILLSSWKQILGYSN